MLKKIILISLFLSFPALADRQDDIAEFNVAFAEYQNQINNSGDIDAAILAAEKVYKLASQHYDIKSEEYAIVIFNLAELYDLRGEEYRNEDEKKALDLYKKFFKIKKNLKAKKDLIYLDQYIKYMFTYYNVTGQYSKSSVAREAIDIAYSNDLPETELANLEYYVGALISENIRFDYAIPHYEKALKLYEKEFGELHVKVGELSMILGTFNTNNRKDEIGLQYLLKAEKIFNNIEDDTTALRPTLYYNLQNYYAEKDQLKEAYQYANLRNALNPKNDEDVTNNENSLPILRVAPNYPALAAKRGQSGYVLVSFTIDKDGNTKDVIPIEYSDKIFVSSAIRAANKYRYSPPENDNGERIEITDVQVRIDYRLER